MLWRGFIERLGDARSKTYFLPPVSLSHLNANLCVFFGGGSAAKALDVIRVHNLEGTFIKGVKLAPRSITLKSEKLSPMKAVFYPLITESGLSI